MNNIQTLDKKNFILPIIIIFMIFCCMSLLNNSINKSNNTPPPVGFQVRGSYNLKELTNYNSSIIYSINNDTINNSIGINISIIYNNMTAITANIFIANDGVSKIKIPLFSSVVYTFNAGEVIPKILIYLYEHKIYPLSFLNTITDINPEIDDYHKPTGSLKELSSDDINYFKQKLYKYFE